MWLEEKRDGRCERRKGWASMFTSCLNFQYRNLDWSARRIDRSPTTMADLSDRLTMVDEQYKWERFYHCLGNHDERQRTRPFGHSWLLLKRRGKRLVVHRTVRSGKQLTIICSHSTEECASTWLSIVRITIHKCIEVVTWRERNETVRRVFLSVRRRLLPVSFFAQALLNSATSFGWT